MSHIGDIIDSSPTLDGSQSDLTDNNESTPWPPDGELDGSVTECWEPYQQYLIIDLSGDSGDSGTGGSEIAFGSIGIGFIADGFNTGYYNSTSYYPPRYFTFAFADSIPDDDIGWQYWAIDFLTDTVTEVTPSPTSINGIFYAINPLDLVRDTDPTDLQNRFTGIIDGIPEMYSVNVSLPYRVSGSSTTQFTTWTLWMLRSISFFLGGDDGNSHQMGQLATVTCRNIFDTNYSSSLSSMSTDTDSVNQCWGTGSSNCNNIYGPPMRFRCYPDDELIEYAYCNRDGINSSYNDWIDCQQGASDVVDCDEQPNLCDAEVDENAFILSSFSCQCMFIVCLLYNCLWPCTREK